MNIDTYISSKRWDTHEKMMNRRQILRHIPTTPTSTLEIAEAAGLPTRVVAATLGKMNTKTRVLKRDNNNGNGTLWNIREGYEDEVRTVIERMNE